MTSAYPAQFLASIDARLRRDGVQTSLAEGVLTLSALNCRVRCELVQGDFHPQLVPLRVLVEHQAFGEPLEDQIAAVATTPDSAVGYATDLWVAAFFNPFHAFAHSGYEHQPLSMVTTSPSGEHLGWQVFTTSPFTNSDSAPTRMEMFKHLITPLNPKLLDRKAHALKCFVQKEPGPCRKAGDNVTASCHFDNREWLEGLSQLLYLGDSWGELSSTRLMRQWFFFRAATKAEIGDSWDKLTLAIQAPSPAKESKQKPWWKVW